MTSILDLCAAGAISPQVALARLVLASEPVDPDAIAAGAPEGSPVREVARLALAHRDRLPSLSRLAGQGLTPEGPDLVAATARLFDRLAGEAPEAAVAFYSLGDPALLDAATDELVEVVRAWAAVAGARVLDLGCGIGRVATALTHFAESVTGVDLSPAMIEQARARARAVAPNVIYEAVDGRSLPFPDGSFDLVLAVDSLPFVVRAGLVETQLAEAARVLRPGGDLIVFNWSYRGDDARDAAEAASAPGFALVRSGERPFRIWDATGYHLRRTA